MQGPLTLSTETRILLVDDTDADQVLMAAFLKPLQCVIDSAANGANGVELFRSRHYDLVLMDFEMPVMCGLEAVREMRGIEQETGVPRTPVLGLTAHTIANVAAKAFDAGFTELLSKPICRKTLLDAVARFSGGEAVVSPEVSVEADVQDLIPAYLEKRRADLAVYRVAVDARDFDTIRKLGHNMKGTGASYGFPGLTELGAEMETAALRSDIFAIRNCLEHFAARVGIA